MPTNTVQSLHQPAEFYRFLLRHRTAQTAIFSGYCFLPAYWLHLPGVMGISPSKRVENALRNSRSFEEAVVRGYDECIDLAQHAFPGLRPYQLLDASARVYNFMGARPGDAASKMRHRWIPEPPTQFEIDDTLRKENLPNGGKTTLNLEEFRLFSLALFRDMVVSNSCRTMVWYAPLGALAVLCSHLAARRLPVIGPKYRNLGPVLPKIMVGYVVGAVAAFYLNLTG